MKYTYKYFKDGMPEWKRKKDPILSKIFYRKVAFFAASICANLGISANTISYASTVVALVSCCMFLVDNHVTDIVAAVLINVWLIMDCTDGNIARSVRKQPFGEFADGISSYILVGFMCTCMGFSVYQSGGILFAKGSSLIILLGALASSSDTMMRLIYQKYKATSREMIDQGKMREEKDVITDKNSVGSLRIRIQAELGVGGILPLMILLCAILNALDLVVIYCFAYYGLACIAMSLLYIRKAIRHTKEYEKNNS